MYKITASFFLYFFSSSVTAQETIEGLPMGSQVYNGVYMSLPSGTPTTNRSDHVLVAKIIRPNGVQYDFCGTSNWVFPGAVLVGAHYGTHALLDGTPGTMTWCNYRYPTYSSADSETPAPPNSCSGNPIENSSGAKIQIETDIESREQGQIEFQRFFNNTSPVLSNPWHFKYQKSITVLGSTMQSQPVKNISGSFASKADACVSGWNELKTKATNSWAASATARFVNNQCQLVKNNVVVKTIPILTQPFENLLMVEGPINISRDDGTSFLFQKTGTQSYVGLNAAPGILTQEFTNGVKWRYVTASNEIEEYSPAGKLMSITYPNGVKQSMSYEAPNSMLSRVQDSTGHSLNFTYVNNQLASVTTDDNKTTSYTYNTLGLITDVKRPDNTHRLYHYEDSRFPSYLTGITDERGVRYATWQYDAQGRAISSEHAGGAEKTSLTFNADGSTTVTNALNKQTIYRFDDVAGARRVVKVEGQPTANCAGANQNYTYTDEGWLASKTDWKGNKTTYAYNAKGQETSRTEAYGTPVAKTITTEWHPTLNLKTKVTEPDKETTYTYDQNGLLTGQKTRSIAAQ